MLLQILTNLRKRFYNGKPIREWKQHEPALRKAICRFGYEAERRGQTLDSAVVEREIGRILSGIEASPDYLPAYLESAVSGYYKREAERLKDAASCNANHIVSNLSVRTTEVMSALYQQMHQAAQAKRLNQKAQRENEKRQGVLL
ncbi:MAG TPA: hypothetical protein VD994_07845 [Prosthecobacter sp.]|nr:hypothetical protein [Prosthecobacter sp.]